MKANVIRVNGTRWVAHIVNALENVINGLQAHIDAYTAISNERNYSVAQKAKAKYFLKKLTTSKFVANMLYSLDVLRTLAIFSKVLFLFEFSVVRIKK